MESTMNDLCSFNNCKKAPALKFPKGNPPLPAIAIAPTIPPQCPGKILGTMDRWQRGHGMREAHSVLGLNSTMLG